MVEMVECEQSREQTDEQRLVQIVRTHRAALLAYTSRLVGGDAARAADVVRKSAGQLDAWYDDQCRGPRPAGRLRSHSTGVEGVLPTRHSWFTAPIYRSFLDPDGRPLNMRLRRTY